MAKRLEYIEEVERQYVRQLKPLSAIAELLDVSLRTLTTWKAEEKERGNDWDTKRANRLSAIQSFPEEIQELARELCRSLKEDLAAGKPIDQSRAILFRGILAKSSKEKEFADAVRKEAEEQKPKSAGILSPERAKEIRAEILGIDEA